MNKAIFYNSIDYPLNLLLPTPTNKAVLGGYSGLNDLKFYIAHFKNIFNIVAKN